MSVVERAVRRMTKDLGPEKKVVVFPPKPATNGHAAKNGKHRDDIDFGPEPVDGPQSPLDSNLPPGALDEWEVETGPIDALVRHPVNRHPKPADVAARAESIKDNGLLTPLLVRKLKGGKLQILSGETRWLACKSLGWKEISYRVRPSVDDAEALELLAIDNAQRTDLDPIEKAQLIDELCRGGKTREAAAKLFGLESGAAASNLVRLLELPKVWQDRVASGELPQSYARPLTTIAKSPLLLKEAEDDYKRAHREKASQWDCENWGSRQAVEGFVQDILDRNTAPIDGVREHGFYVDGAGYRKAPRLFELTDDVRKQLQVIEITIDGKPVEVATNVKLFEKLQTPLLKAKSKAKAAAAADGDEKKVAKKSSQKPLTPAQQKAKAKEAAELLAKRIDGWRSIWLKSLIAPKLEAGRNVTTRLFAALVWGGYHDHHHALSRGLEDAAKKYHGHGLAAAWQALRDDDQDEDQLVVDALRRVLAEEDNDPRKPLLSFDFIDAVAAEYSIDLAAEWKRLQTADRDRLEQFLELHTGDQLDALAAEWKRGPIGASKKQKLALLLAGGRDYPLPKSIAALPKAKAAKPVAALKSKRGRK